MDRLAARRKTIGVPYVLIGRQTFSAAVSSADRLRRKAKAVLVGEPTGGLRSGFGEAPVRQLPRSKLSVQWTIKNFGSSGAIDPDRPVKYVFADLRAGRDPALEAALAAK